MTGRIPTLDGWRFAAVSLVIFFHSLPMGDESRAWMGHLGVDIFFGLSGYLITALLLQEHERTGRIDLLAFYRRRAFRILPPLWAFLIFAGIFSLFESRLELLSALLFFRNYIGIGGIATTHLWSLAVEEHFYLLWPTALVLVGVARSRNWIGYYAAAIALWRLVMSSTHWAGLGGRTDFRLDSLLWGCAVAFIMESEAARSALAATLRPWIWLSMAAMVVLPRIYFHDLSLAPLLLIATCTTPLLIPFVIAGTVLHPEWLLSRALELPPLRWIGRLSNSLYLWQELFLFGGKLHHSSVAINLALTFAAACISYYLIEKPCIRLGRRVRQPRPVLAFAESAL